MGLIAFKTYDQAPVNTRPPSVPLEWVWSQLEIPENQAESFRLGGFKVMTEAEFKNYLDQRSGEFYLWANAYDFSKPGEVLRVLELVDDNYKSLPIQKIDFRLHLRSEVYLQKSVVMLANGRPQKALYTYNGQLIAEINFTFEVDAFNFMTRRIETLTYFKKSDMRLPSFVIYDQSFDRSNPYHLRQIMSERSEARSLIIEEIKAFLNGVLAAYYGPQGKTYVELLTMVGAFWAKYSNSIDAWINVGSPQFQYELTIDRELELLTVPVAQGVTVKDYILSKTSY